MRTPQDVERGLTAPERLGLETRVEIRKAATQLLDEMPDGARLVILQQLVDQGAVADVALHEDVARVFRQRFQGFQVAGVGEGIQVDHRLAGGGDPVEHKVRADEACAAGDKNHVLEG